MTNLEKYTQRAIQNGWTIVSLSADNVVLKKKKSINSLVAIAGIIGLFFFIVPGLLILLLGYVARGEETAVVSSAQAENFEVARAQQLAEKAARRAMTLGERLSTLTLFEKAAGIGIALFLLTAILYAAL